MTDAKRDTARDEARDHAPLWTPPPEFLRELPDLISGKDPELLRPEARAWMLRDPQARELAQEICGAIATFADVPSRMARTTPEPISLRAKRSVERAAKQLPQRLAEVLWPLLTLELDRVGASNQCSIVIASDTGRTLDVSRLLFDRDRLVELFPRSQSAQIRSVLRPHASNPALYGAEARTTALVKARQFLIGGSVADTWVSMLVPHFAFGDADIAQWRILAHQSLAARCGDHVRASCALVLSNAGDFRGAIDLTRDVVSTAAPGAAQVGACYTGLRISLLHGFRDDVAFFIDGFARSLDANPSLRSIWQARFLIDAEDWLLIHARNPRHVELTMSMLGES